MKVLVDTNVYLELLLKRENYQAVSKFFYLALLKRNQTFVTAMSLRDIGYVVHRCIHDNETTKQLQLQVYSMTSKVLSTSADCAIESLYSDNSDYEDSLQMLAAEEAMLDAIVTFNKKDFSTSKIPVFTPIEICEHWKQ